MQCVIGALLLSGFFMQVPQWRSLSTFILIFCAYAGLFYAFNCYLLLSGSEVTFKPEGVKNAGKRPPIPYEKFEKAIFESITLKETSFRLVSIIYKDKSRSKTKIEYGLYAGDDTSSLIIFLKERGLPIEDRIKFAPTPKIL